MKTTSKPKNTTYNKSHSSTPFFLNNNGKGTFFSNSKKVEPSFFYPSSIQTKPMFGEQGDKTLEITPVSDSVIQCYRDRWRPPTRLPRSRQQSPPPCSLPCYPSFHSVLCPDGTPVTVWWETHVYRALNPSDRNDPFVVAVSLMHWNEVLDALDRIRNHIEHVRICIRDSDLILSIDKSRLLRRIQELIIPALVNIREEIMFRALYSQYTPPNVEERIRRAAAYTENFFCI